MTPLSPAPAYARRLGALFARAGESLTLSRAGTDLPRTGLFAPLDNGAAGAYFDANESVGLLKPALMLYTEGTADPPQAGDVFTRDGRLWTVRKVQVFRVAGTALLTLALCD